MEANNEKALIGVKAISEYLGWPLSTLYTRVPEFKEAGIWLSRIRGSGVRHRAVYTFPSLLQRWLILKEQEKQEIKKGSKI